MANEPGFKKVVWIAVLFVIVLVIAVAYLRRSGSEPPKPIPPPAAVPAQKLAKVEFHSFRYDGPIPEKFHEAPDLARLVKAGKLPPVEQRLPREPLVVPPVERIGRYGGTWHRGFTGPADKQNADRIMHDHLIYYDLDGFTIVPHIAKSWEISDNARTFTFKLRKGMKWSDGSPFTAEDFMFAYRDLILNDELNPAKPDYLKPGGKLGRLEKVDDYTIRYVFSQPHYVMLEMCASLYVAGQSTRGGYGYGIYAPKHYLKQFHPKYASKERLNKMIEEAGLENWVQLFKLQADAHLNPELPVVGPWKVVRPITSQLYVLERNPYYWAVDTAGNQLPYIDKIVMQLAEDLEVLNLRAIAGQIDMQGRHILLGKVPVLKANAAKGNYRILLWPHEKGTEMGVCVNQTWEGDPEIEKWLRNRDFRIALSLAIDREEINETIFLGMGKVRAAIPARGTPFYPGPEYEKKYIRHDVAEANAILDRLGLDKKDAQGFRLRTDGKGRLVLTLAIRGNAFLDMVGAAELLERHWAKAGIKVNVSVQERSFWQTRRRANEHQLSLGAGGSMNPWTSQAELPVAPVCAYAINVGLWYETGGEKGVAPTGPLKQLLELFDRGKAIPFNRRIEVGREIYRILTDNVYVIGTVGRSPASSGVVVVKNDFRNVPEVAANSTAAQTPGVARPEQFFFAR